MSKSSISDFPIIPANARSLVMRKLTHGKGVNDSNYITQPLINGVRIKCPFYVAWEGMIKRCYSSLYHQKQPTYIGCSVTPEWLYFSNFRKWMIDQDWKDKQLDKDMLIIGNKLYSPYTCLFVTSQVNTIFNHKPNHVSNKYPTGVSFDKHRDMYKSCIGLYGKQIQLGRYSTPEEARRVYIKAKSAYIREVANKQSNPLRSAMLQRI